MTQHMNAKQKAAWKRTHARMKKGFHLGGKGIKRDELYESGRLAHCK